MTQDAWKSRLNADPTDWLLQETNPSVRYLTLIDILDKHHQDPEVLDAKKAIMTSGVVPRILAKQKNDGYWEARDKFYTAKYKGTVWQLIVLAELDADPADERIKSACEFILKNSQEHTSGGFSQHAGAKIAGGLRSEVIPCLTGNMVWSLIKLGYLEDPRLQSGIDWMTKYQRYEDGAKTAPKGWPYDPWEICWGKHTCHMGVVKSLKALAEIPRNMRSKEVNQTIERACEFLLIHHIYKRSHDLKKTSKPSWRRLGFPLMYQTDVLETLGLLAKLGYSDKRMSEAIELVISRQNKLGRWKLQSTFNGRFQANVEVKGKSSKWVTLNALRMLKRVHIL